MTVTYIVAIETLKRRHNAPTKAEKWFHAFVSKTFVRKIFLDIHYMTDREDLGN
jgi:hypothetical protein